MMARFPEPRGAEGAAARASRTRRTPRYRLSFEVLEDRMTPVIMVTDLTMTTATALVQTLVGNTPVSNITFKGAPQAAGIFTGAQQAIGFDSGIVLSTGHANAIPGPNIGNNQSFSNNQPGDPILSGINGGTPTFDAAELSFDFVAQGPSLHFNYVFGSNEYLIFVNAGFPDVFAFFLDGQNIAFIPGTNTPVDINTINPGLNSQFYIDNPVGSGNRPINLNGITTILPININVTPGQTHHLELAIADAGDSILDSDVMLQASTGGGGVFPIQAERPLRYTYDSTTGIYSGDITLFNASSTPINGPNFLAIGNLPVGVTVVNAQTISTGSFTSATISNVIPVNNNSIAPGATARVTIQLRDPLNVPLGTFFEGYSITLVQGT